MLVCQGRETRGKPTPLVGPFAFPIACITLPFSSVTSRTQSAFPVATSTCVLQPLT